MDQEDLIQQGSERIIDLTKAISGIEGKRLQSIAFKIYNARKEVWEKVKSRKPEGSKKPIHDELQRNLEEFLEKKKEEKKIDVEQVQKFKNTDQFTKQIPTVGLYQIIQRGLPQDINKIKKFFDVQDSDSD